MLQVEDAILMVKQNADQLSALPDDQKKELDKLVKQLDKKNKHYDKLETGLDQDLSLADLNQTHYNLNCLSKEINELIQQLKKVLSNCYPGSGSTEIEAAKKIALELSRKGSVNIRPGAGNYTQPAVRKKYPPPGTTGIGTSSTGTGFNTGSSGTATTNPSAPAAGNPATQSPIKLV